MSLLKVIPTVRKIDPVNACKVEIGMQESFDDLARGDNCSRADLMRAVIADALNNREHTLSKAQLLCSNRFFLLIGQKPLGLLLQLWLQLLDQELLFLKVFQLLVTA